MFIVKFNGKPVLTSMHVLKARAFAKRARALGIANVTVGWSYTLDPQEGWTVDITVRGEDGTVYLLEFGSEQGDHRKPNGAWSSATVKKQAKVARTYAAQERAAAAKRKKVLSGPPPLQVLAPYLVVPKKDEPKKVKGPKRNERKQYRTSSFVGKRN